MSDRNTAGDLAIYRFLAPAAFFVVRLWTSQFSSPTEHVVAAFLDVFILWSLWWAISPIAAGSPVRFSRSDSPTRLLLVPLIVASCYFIRDFLSAISSR